MNDTQRTLRQLLASTVALGLSVTSGAGLRAADRAAPERVVASRAPAAVLGANDHVLTAYGRVPLSFERNEGQTAPEVKFLSHGPDYTLFLTAREAVLILLAQPARADGVPVTAAGATSSAHVVLRMTFEGATRRPHVAGLERLPGLANYFIGKDPARWHTSIPTYARVAYRDVYPGMDLLYHGKQGQLEYDFVVRPGSSPAAIKLRFEGAERVELDGHGDLLLHTAGGVIRQSRPQIYQEAEGRRRQISGGYLLQSPSRVGFRVGDYDRRRPLVIDPMLVYSTYLGGSSFDDGLGIAVDGAGSAYVTGRINSADFPSTLGSFDTSFNAGEMDAFVTKLDGTGSALVYSTYLGGSSRDEAFAIAVDAVGSAYVTGRTSSANFPTTPGAFDPSFNGELDAFVTKLDATGSALAYSTYLGGSQPAVISQGDSDEGYGIAVDAAGSAYVTGYTSAAGFPATPGGFDRTYNGAGDAFVTKLNAAGSAPLVYSTYLGGSREDWGLDITVDSSGSAYVTGITNSADFPTTPGALDPTLNGGIDAFVTKLDVTGSTLAYSTYLGGTGFEQASGIAVDAAGSAYVTGITSSANFPTTPGAFDLTLDGSHDAFVTKLNAAGSAPLIYSTYLGGSSSEEAFGIAVDAAGSAYVTGFTRSADFPTTPGTVDPTFNGNADGFVTKLDATGSGPLLYSTYVGGSNENVSRGIAVDGAGSAYVTGITASTDFPTTPGAFDTTPNGSFGAFVAKIGEVVAVPIDIKPGSFPNSINPRSQGRIPVAVLSTTGFNAPAQVDPRSLSFGRTGNEPSLAFCNTSSEDVNGDALGDLVCHFGTQATGFQVGDTRGFLKGRTLADVPIVGTDSVQIVP